MVRGCFGFRVEDSGLQRSMVCVFVGSGVGFAVWVWEPWTQLAVNELPSCFLS